MMINRLSRLRRAFLTYFPPACAGCDGTSSQVRGFCSVCLPTAHRIEPPFCDLCMVPSKSFSPPGDELSLCSRCYESPPAFDSVRALWEYDGAVADAIRRIKYGADFPALRALGREARPWFSEQLLALPPKAPIFCVPAHRDELRRRGFHLPTLAFKIIAPTAVGRLRPDLKKVRPTQAQASLPFGARKQNMKGAFRWAARPGSITGSAILFDDVLTTGATAAAAAGVLKAAGFDQVHALVLARATAPFEPSRPTPMAQNSRSG